MKTVLEIHGLSKQFGKQPILTMEQFPYFPVKGIRSARKPYLE